MDLADIQRQALAARELPAPPQAAGRVTATLRIPTRHEVQLALQRAGPQDDAGRMVTLERHLLEAAVVGWAGVQLRDVLPGHPNDDAMLHEAGAVPLLLDAQPDWAQAWGLVLFEAMRQSRQTQDAAEKNS
jgi:hypothetical protein